MADVPHGIAELNDISARLSSGTAASDLNSLGIGSLLGNMSMTMIIINILAGLVGSAYFMYGRRTCNIKVVCWGVALCIVPYFIGNTPLLIVACLAMAAAPFVI